MSWSRKSENGWKVTSLSAATGIGPVRRVGRWQGAADRAEDDRAGPNPGRLRAARGRGQERHEVREQDQVLVVLLVRLVVRERVVARAARSPLRGVLVRDERGGDAHLIRVGVAREVEEGRELGLPAEAADGRVAGGEVPHDVRPSPRSRGGRPLELGDLAEGPVGHRLDQPEAEERRRPPPRPDGGLPPGRPRRQTRNRRSIRSRPRRLLLDDRAAELNQRVEPTADPPADSDLDDRAPAADVGDRWHFAQAFSVKTGPSPSAANSSSSNASLPTRNRWRLRRGEPGRGSPAAGLGPEGGPSPVAGRGRTRSPAGPKPGNDLRRHGRHCLVLRTS